jgi:hypothetical protein
MIRRFSRHQLSCYQRDVRSRATVFAIQFSGKDYSQPGSGGHLRALGRKRGQRRRFSRPSRE